MKKRKPIPYFAGKKEKASQIFESRNVGINLQTVWDLDDLIEETQILLQVCTRLRDKRLHNKRCCINCKFLDAIRTLVCDKCEAEIKSSKHNIGDFCPTNVALSQIPGASSKCDGHLKSAGVPDRYLCINEKMVKLMENPIEFDFDGDLRTFVCPFMEFSEDDTKIVKYKELKKLLNTE